MSVASSTGIISLAADDMPEPDEFGNYDLSSSTPKRVILAPVVLTPEAVCEKKIAEGMKLIETAHGQAKELCTNGFENATEQESWENVLAGLQHITDESKMFFAKTKFGDLGCCETVIKTMRWLISDDGEKTKVFSEMHIGALVRGCNAIASLADTEIANKIRMGRSGAIGIALGVLRALKYHQNQELCVSALQVLLNLPKSIITPHWNKSKHPVVQQFGEEDTVGRMLDEGVDTVLLSLYEQALSSLEELGVPHTAGKLVMHQAYIQNAPGLHKVIDMVSRLLQSLSNTGAEARNALLEDGAGAAFLRALHHSMPILPVPSAADVPPLNFEDDEDGSTIAADEEKGKDTTDEEDDDNYNPKKEAAEAAARQQDREITWNKAVKHKEELGKLTTEVNKYRYESQLVMIRSLIAISLDERARVLISDGHNDATNAVKVLYSVMKAAFHDAESLDYRSAKLAEIDNFKMFQTSHGWQNHHAEIFREVKRNPHMHQHRKTTRPTLLQTMTDRHSGNAAKNRKPKGQIDRGPPKSPTRSTLNLHHTPRVDLHPGGKQTTGLLSGRGGMGMGMGGGKSSVLPVEEKKRKSPPCLCVAEHACWALCILTVRSCGANRLELLECGTQELQAMAASVFGEPDEFETLVVDNKQPALEHGSRTNSRPTSRGDAIVGGSVSTSHCTSPVPELPLDAAVDKLQGFASIALPAHGEENGSLGSISERGAINTGRSKDGGTSGRASIAPAVTMTESFTGRAGSIDDIVNRETMNALDSHEVPFYSRLHKLLLHVNETHQSLRDEAEEGHLPVVIREDDIKPPASAMAFFVTE